mmetsp:Transcript_20235/g.47237  ORF Transcript_20235/g.47237 Transcript_20235/m.47237 type:complete len:95 (-) Transcript_20235:1168-1452(-)
MAMAAAMAPYNTKPPAKEILAAKGRKVVVTTPHTILLEKVAALIALPRNLSGNSSEASSQQTGPAPIENAATMSITAAAATSGVWNNKPADSMK